ncbi:cytochrome c oxidase accessory protein CcoG [Terrihabitans soli]|uniref:Cytochrome c oxidase accessory protein CcoG n=1 Tax=Terrihabitans soli TaxID=708113 RepID=A0A6S6QLR8_9HYPH|nr:cytochrome c oxidase accessory protein CcoG [Terrihabitans soli]BCJ92283.1 cytochrome c oxidase accessory protein CcoG [Terrihabitans soli]
MISLVINHAKDRPASHDNDEGPLYAGRQKIFPNAVHGKFRRIKTALLIVTLGIYYFLPFVRWDRGPDAPGQAVLVDFAHQRFYFFFIEIWPQEVYYITGLLILAALALFLMNAVGGRVWCGYLCPQTVWTDLFLAVERFVEGDRRSRIRLENAPWSVAKLIRRSVKHTIWLAIAWWTGGAWVLYFADAPTLVHQLATLTAPPMAWIWIGILTATTYTLAGHMREQVCTYMCPWPRIQAALTDEDALTVTYRYDRGEPRGHYKKNEALRLAGLPAGDCVDCFQCLHACPTGVDIRDGNQLACVNCGLCVDACDSVMTKLNRPTGLIAYDNDANIRRRLAGEKEVRRIVRPRTILYAGLILFVAGIMAFALGTREVSGISVLHDRNPVYIRLSDGTIRNGYTLRLLNKLGTEARFALSVTGLNGAEIEAVGIAETESGRPVVMVRPDQTQEVRLLVTYRDELPPQASIRIGIVATPVSGGEAAIAYDYFKGP